jgi:hypothetical protein
VLNTGRFTIKGWGRGDASEEWVVGALLQILSAMEQDGSHKEAHLRELVTSCGPEEMKFLVMIILKDLKVLRPPTLRNPIRASQPRIFSWTRSHAVCFPHCRALGCQRMWCSGASMRVRR